MPINQFENKIVIGLVETISIKCGSSLKEVLAKIDSGATKSSLDKNLAEELEIGPVIKSKLVKSAHGNKIRPVVEAEIVLANKVIRAEFTIADRNHMKYPALIGQNILKEGFLIDPNKYEQS